MTEEDEHPGPASSTPKPSSRTRRVYDSAQTRGTETYERGRLWIANQDPASHKGATIGWVRRYHAADGQLYAVLLSAYLFLTLVPLLLVFSSYVYSGPEAAAKRVERRRRQRRIPTMTTMTTMCAQEPSCPRSVRAHEGLPQASPQSAARLYS